MIKLWLKLGVGDPENQRTMFGWPGESNIRGWVVWSIRTELWPGGPENPNLIANTAGLGGARESENYGHSRAWVANQNLRRVVQGIKKLGQKPGLCGPGNREIRTEARLGRSRESEIGRPRESENWGRSRAGVVQRIRKLGPKPGSGVPANQTIEAGRGWSRESEN